MRNLTIYLVVLLCLLASKMLGQETFEKKVQAIAYKIERITIEEKEALKSEVEEVNIQLEKGLITKEEADLKKQQFAETRAAIIENKVAIAQEELKDLVQAKVDGKITEQDSVTKRSVFIWGHKVINGQTEFLIRERRTTSQFVFATGLNNLITDSNLENSDYRFLGSHFYEWGLSYNSRILKNDNLLHAKYGLSLMYNNLRPTDNRFFEVNGDKTILQSNSIDPSANSIDIESSRLRNVYLVVPFHLEFDFSGKEVENDKTYYKTHQSWRIGFGGYTGIRLKTKQILKYQVDNESVTGKIKSGYNSSDFIYGLSSFIGYKATSLYLKYDLNPLFKNNDVKQNNVSLGIRFDVN